MIEKNIPVPKRATKNDELSLLIGEMGVGDSIFFKHAKKQSDTEIERVRKKMYRNGWRVAVRQVDNGVRIWRIE